MNSPADGTPYPITVSAGNLSAANYTFTYAPGLLTILPASGLPQTIISITKRADGVMVLDCGGAANQTYLLQVLRTSSLIPGAPLLQTSPTAAA